MLSWIVIVVLVIMGIVLIKMNHFRHRGFIIVLVLVALFFYVTMYIVSSKNDLNLNTVDGIYHSIKIYTGWLANGFQNLKTLTGSAVKMDWTSTNGTFIGNKSKTANQKKPSTNAGVRFKN